MLTKDDLEKIQKIVQREVDPVKMDTVKIRKDVKQIVSSFDCEYLELRERVENIEHRLGITYSS